MTVRGNFQGALDGLASAERRVAEYVLDNPETVLSMNVQELAAAAETSAATVSRVVRRLNFAGYNELKLQLAADLSNGQDDASLDDAIRQNEDLHSLKAKLLANAERSLRETVDQVHDDNLDLVLPLLHGARHLLIFGVGASYLVAQNIAQKWSRLGYACTVSDDLNVFLPPAMATDPDNAVVWFVSNSGESPEAVMAAKLAHSAGLPVIATTKIGQNSLTKYADYTLQTSQPVEGHHRFAATQSLHAQFMLVDIVYYAFVSRYYEEAARSVSVSREAVAEYKRSLRNGFK
ncbi:MurR/RpiR family transcriptional regulator [Lacticaseibacillus hulanensis]|uniref:MurR/RpiR family transcriptional regulator n=1 Tax=Lacticaseibacillus hulanensis TaxID=2493111 RepID=UPI000FDC6EF1|nr:MurR/RpiR family transcriptional regulator [Lacticaseibacillus hulanensis]